MKMILMSLILVIGSFAAAEPPAAKALPNRAISTRAGSRVTVEAKPATSQKVMQMLYSNSQAPARKVTFVEYLGEKPIQKAQQPVEGGGWQPEETHSSFEAIDVSNRSKITIEVLRSIPKGECTQEAVAEALEETVVGSSGDLVIDITDMDSDTKACILDAQ